MFLCVDCLKENVACTQNGQCCPGSECIYGRCKTGAAAGQAGKIVNFLATDRVDTVNDADYCISGQTELSILKSD